MISRKHRSTQPKREQASKSDAVLCRAGRLLALRLRHAVLCSTLPSSCRLMPSCAAPKKLWMRRRAQVVVVCSRRDVVEDAAVHASRSRGGQKMVSRQYTLAGAEGTEASDAVAAVAVAAVAIN